MKVSIPEPMVTLEMTVREAIEVYDFAWDAYQATRSLVMGQMQAELGAALEDAGYGETPIPDDVFSMPQGGGANEGTGE